MSAACQKYFLLLVMSYSCIKTHAINNTFLLEQRILMCGPKSVCNPEQFEGPFLNPSSYNGLQKCPPCHCDNLCIAYGDCCPDYFFKLPPQTCVNVTIIEASVDKARRQTSKYLMVSSCPNGSKSPHKLSCEGEKSIEFRLRYPPVTSNTSGLSYPNKFCALCNNDNEYDTWYLDIGCKKLSDFNFLSTIEEVIDQAFSDECVLQTYPPKNNYAHNCFHNTTAYFDRCNKTGLWENLNRDIEYACQTHFHEFQKSKYFFKNSFCRLCNPSVRVVPLVSSCNVTGMWKPYNVYVREACIYYPESSATFPYKNIFCYFCNKNNLDDRYPFHDIISNFTAEEFLFENGTLMFHYYFFNERFSERYFNFIKLQYESKRQTKWMNHSTSFLTPSGRTVNISSLIQKKISLTDSIRVCDRNLVPNIFQNPRNTCSCDPTLCLFNAGYSECCDDILLKYPVTCTSRMELSSSNFQTENDTEYLLTNGCYNQKTYPEFSFRRCKRETDDIFSLLPVNDLSTNVLYKNYYCLSCNNFDLIYHSIPTYHDPWDIYVLCNQFLEFDFHLLFSDLLKTLKKMECKVKYYPIRKGEKKNVHFPNFMATTCYKRIKYSMCNETGMWPKLDEDVKWACEDQMKGSSRVDYGYNEYDNDGSDKFKNSYCILCNPGTNMQPTINTCKTSATDVDKKRCEYFPKIYYLSPFKNLACRYCNGLGVAKPGGGKQDFDDKDDVPHRPYNPWLPVYRSLFSVNPGKDYGTKEMQMHNCGVFQVYDTQTNTCRNITCYPGKFNSIASCEPLFDYTIDLRYTISLMFSGTSKFAIPAIQMMKNVHDSLSNEIKTRLSLSIDPVVHIHIDVNQPCLSLIQKKFDGRILLNLLIYERVLRLQVEKILLDFTNSSIQTVVNNNTLSITLQEDLLRHQYSLVPTPGFHNICNFLSGQNLQFPYRHYRLVKLSKLLLCRQVKIFSGEFMIDKKSSKLFLKNHNRYLNIGEYDILPSGEARICLEDFKIDTSVRSHLTTTAFVTNLQNSLWILTLTCNIISLLFLLVTFITYCLFPELRTIPGKNNMAVISSLFATHLFFQISNSVEPGRALCAFFGVGLHFVWLVLFTCMIAASFHMFRIFHPRLSIKHHVSQKISFLKYCIFSVVTPLVIVLVNIIVFLSVSNGSSVGYGDTTCFIDNYISRIVCFIIPVGLACLVNIFFFVGAARNIHRRSRINNNRTNSVDFFTICKLFTITGIAWLLQIIDGFLPFSAFSFLATIVTSLQGLFIFVAFMCNARTRQMYKTLYKKYSLSKFKTLFSSGISETYAGENRINTITDLSYRKKESE